jgi:hypothetical protein
MESLGYSEIVSRYGRMVYPNRSVLIVFFDFEHDWDMVNTVLDIVSSCVNIPEDDRVRIQYSTCVLFIDECVLYHIADELHSIVNDEIPWMVLRDGEMIDGENI